MDDPIRKAVSVLRMYRDHSDEALYAELVGQGFEPRLAARLIEFLPMAYFRIMLAKSGACFSGDFQRELPDGTIVVRSLHTEPVWVASLEFAPC